MYWSASLLFDWFESHIHDNIEGDVPPVGGGPDALRELRPLRPPVTLVAPGHVVPEVELGRELLAAPPGVGEDLVVDVRDGPAAVAPRVGRLEAVPPVAVRV